MTNQSGTPRGSSPAAKELLALFLACGYVRQYSVARRDREGHRKYKKGFEVRLVLRHPGELQQARRLLDQVGFTPAASFRKHSRYIQPVYGQPAFEWFVQKLPRGAAGRDAGFTASAARRVRRRWADSRPGAKRRSNRSAKQTAWSIKRRRASA